MIIFPSITFYKLWLKNTKSRSRNERMHYFEKKPRKLYKCQHFFGFQLARAAPVLEAGGKPSTWFPPEGLVELTCHARGMRMSQCAFIIEKWKISKNFKNLIFLKFKQNLPVTFTITFVEQIYILLAP